MPPPPPPTLRPLNLSLPTALVAGELIWVVFDTTALPVASGGSRTWPIWTSTEAEVVEVDASGRLFPATTGTPRIIATVPSAQVETLTVAVSPRAGSAFTIRTEWFYRETNPEGVRVLGRAIMRCSGSSARHPRPFA